MKSRIVKAIGIGFGVIMMASIAAAAPTCLANLGADVTTLNGGGGCTVGNLTFNNFAVTLAGGSGSPLVNLSGVNNPGVGGTGLNFNPNLGLGHTVTDIHFLFSVTSSGGPIGGAYLFNGGTGNGGIGERVCSLGEDINGQCTNGGTELAFLNALSGAFDSKTLTNQAQTTIWVWKDVSIDNPAVDHNSSFNQNFTVVPEPATLSMMGLGLLGLGLLGRKIRK